MRLNCNFQNKHKTTNATCQFNLCLQNLQSINTSFRKVLEKQKLSSSKANITYHLNETKDISVK